MKRIRIAQIGICHEHAPGKFAVLKKRSDIFDFVGYVDERTFCATPLKSVFFDEKEYAGPRKLTLNEALNWPGLDAVTVDSFFFTNWIISNGLSLGSLSFLLHLQVCFREQSCLGT